MLKLDGVVIFCLLFEFSCHCSMIDEVIVFMCDNAVGPLVCRKRLRSTIHTSHILAYLAFFFKAYGGGLNT